MQDCPDQTGQSPSAAVPVSNARRGEPEERREIARAKTEEGKARSAQNALKHGMRAQKHLVLPDEDGAEFAGLEAALVAELAPVGALQTVLARRIAVAAWRPRGRIALKPSCSRSAAAPTAGSGSR